ncbi:anti-sigma factor domain-containing protein [Streptomyces sp. NPDC007088]|uniref:anti-sigma factor n=1 Tax=Streptomyces sp. NPDC007088 TaxID=3364773 RepID=UPI00368007CF
MTAVDSHVLTGAYALHALGDEERAEFERHLAHCASCAEEVREFTETAARLGLAVSVPPPPALREAVLARIADVRQEAPHTARVGRPRGTRQVRGRRLGRWALAACLAAAAALGGTAVWQHQRADEARLEAREARDLNARLTAVLSAPDAKARTAGIKGGGRATVVVSRKADGAVFAAAGLPKPPPGKTYQLWFDVGGTMRPAGLLGAGHGSGTVLMDGSVAGASGMGVTVEPAGGSKAPTSDPVALMALPA